MWPAQAEVEIGRAVVRRNRPVPRHAQGSIAKIGEQRRLAVRRHQAGMATCTIAALWIVEQREATCFLRRQTDRAAQEDVIVAAERTEYRRTLLVEFYSKPQFG